MSSLEQDAQFEELLSYIRDERGFDFTGYKRPSLRRRITKRMQDAGVDSFGAYQDYLEKHAGEFGELFNTILINVTAFFRDEVAWDYLRAEIAPRIIEDHSGPDGQIRMWSTGCATGEEAYSLAMIFADALGAEEFKERVKIYATDIDDDALKTGRHAEYSAKAVTPVPPEFLERFFEPRDGRYVFQPDLRRSVIFGKHDLLQDPPISRVSLLLSRNTLMYFDTATQRRVLASFHFALRPHGYLFLGKSEALAARSDLFTPVDLRRRVFQKVPRELPARGDLAPAPAEDELQRLAADALVREAGFEAVPVAVLVVDREGQLTLANLQARTYFGLTQRDIGRAFKDLQVSFSPIELRSRIEQVYAERHVISLRDVEWHTERDVRFLDVQLAPLVATTGAIVGVGITFTEVTRYRRLQQALEESKREMETAYEELQSTVEELETTNEELQSTNEELETTNEELQSTNEELETMNEELHSTNEELETMNDELNDRTLEMNNATAFLSTVLGSLRAGIAVLDTELLITAWNEAARDLWGLRPDEVVGQHFLNLDIGLPVDDLRTPIRETIKSGEPREVTVAALNRRGRQISCQVSVMPLLDGGGDPTGAIVLMQEPQGDGASP